MSKPVDLNEVEALCTAATKGPWQHRFGDYGNNHGVFFGPSWTQNIALQVGGAGNGGVIEAHANAAFIAWCRSGVPQLVAELKAARFVVAVAREVGHDSWCGHGGTSKCDCNCSALFAELEAYDQAIGSEP